MRNVKMKEYLYQKLLERKASQEYVNQNVQAQKQTYAQTKIALSSQITQDVWNLKKVYEVAP